MGADGYDLLEQTLDKIIKMCKELEHPKHKEWDWNDTSNSKRAKFYQNHIVHAWKQAGNHMAREIEKLKKQ